MDNQDWIERLKPGSGSRDLALEELRQTLLKGIRGALGKRGADHAFCEDVAQESLLKIVDKLEEFRGESRFTTWAITIAIRTGISMLRRRQFRDVAVSQLGDQNLSFEFEEQKQTTPDEDIEKQSSLAMLKQAIETSLTEKQRAVVQNLLDGMPVEVIAEKTGSNRNAIYKLFHDARKKLKSALEKMDFQFAGI